MRRTLAAVAILVALAGCSGADKATETTTTSGSVEDQLPFASTPTSSSTMPTTVATTAAPATAPTTVVTAPPTTRATAPPTTRAPVTTAAPVTQPPATPAPSVYFANCAAARAAGAAPVRRGDPGYGTHLDRDGDGVGCEN